jgi:hypothetical protein
MNVVAPLLVIFSLYAILTQPSGQTIYIVKSAVVAVSKPTTGECTQDSHARVVTSGGVFCVAEDPEDVARKVAE